MNKQIVSFGCMCSTALFLKKNGYRSFSSFFDWLDGGLFEYIKVVNNDFKDVLNYKFLVQKFTDFPQIITNVFYNFSFVHLFDERKTFRKQIKNISKKCSKQINNFKKALSSKNLILVYYIRKKKKLVKSKKILAL